MKAQKKLKKLKKNKNLIYLPLKSPPCKKCPALAKGKCKCAVKKIA